jgi:hypothetical protein
MTLLTSEEKELLVRAANLIDESLETLEVMQDEAYWGFEGCFARG